MWRFLVDEDMPRTTAPALRDAGYEAEDVRDAGLSGTSDQRIFEYAQSHEATIITEDKDFSSILNFPLGQHYGIVVLRVPNSLSVQQTDVILLSALQRLEGQTLEGALIIVTIDRVRVRRK